MTRKIEVLERLALMGANLYSHGPVIKWKLDLGEFEDFPSNAIPGFVDRLKAMIPSLIEHRCSEGVRGGFLTRLELGTWMGHVMEHIALELQNLAGSAVGFGRARSAGRRGVYNVVYECEERETGIAAGELALEIIHHLAESGFSSGDERAEFPYAERLESLRTLHGEVSPPQWMRAIIRAARARAIPSFRQEGGFVQLGHGAYAKRIHASSTSLTPHQSVLFATDRVLTRSRLVEHGIPMAAGMACRTVEDAIEAAKELGWPVVIAPADVTLPEEDEIVGEKSLRRAAERLLAKEKRVVVSKPVDGSVFRLLVVGRRLIAAARLDKESATSGRAVDVTDAVHPSVLALVDRVAALVGLDIGAIEVRASRIDQSMEETGGVVTSVAATPEFDLHLDPERGDLRDIAGVLVDHLFPAGVPSRVPILTVTGTNGKTTTARLCGHIASQAGRHVGLATTDGIVIRNRPILRGDLTGPHSAGVVLQDPAVDFAVLETARGGILRAGLGYDMSDVAIVTNIAEDHLGLRDVNTVEDLARVKAVTVERVSADGFAVLNAEDGMTPIIRDHANARIALFSTTSDNEAFLAHVGEGRSGCTVEADEIILYDRGVRVMVTRVNHVPLTFGGKARFNVANVLAAVLACHALGIDLDAIRLGVETLFPSVAQTPGRTNFIEYDGFTVMIDYAHNPHGVAAMAEFIGALNRKRSIATIAVPGDRRDSDIEEVARIAARSFDEVILREDYHTRGRERGEVAALMRAAMLEAGFPEDRIYVCTDELGSLELGLTLCGEGDLLLYFADKVDEATALLERKRLERESGSGARGPAAGKGPATVP